jgi:hypothetical protein
VTTEKCKLAGRFGLGVIYTLIFAVCTPSYAAADSSHYPESMKRWCSNRNHVDEYKEKIASLVSIKYGWNEDEYCITFRKKEKGAIYFNVVYFEDLRKISVGSGKSFVVGIGLESGEIVEELHFQ